MDEPLSKTYLWLRPELLRLAASVVGVDDASDVVSDVYLRIADSSGASNPAAYLRRAVVNAAISHERSRRRRMVRDNNFLRWWPGRPTISPSRDLDVERALRALSVQQRAIIHLTYWSDFTPARVGEELDITEGSVKKQLARARATLREELANGRP